MKSVLSKKTELVNFECKLSDDRLKLFISITPNFNEKSTPDEFNQEEIRRIICNAIEDLVNAEAVETNVLFEALNEALAGKKVDARRIAKGTPPGAARDGKLVFLVKKLGSANQLLAEKDGKVDFKNLYLFDNIEIDQAVVRVYPPVKGSDGLDALGKVITGPTGKPVLYQIDKTLEIKQDANNSYTSLHAKVAGLLFQNGDRLSILEQLHIKSDIDYSTGNIDFIGSVLVAGNVRPGFRVRARKDIEIKGNLETASLESSEGSIVVKGSVVGSPETFIRSAKDVTLKTVSDQKVCAGGNIIVAKEARSCFLEAQSIIRITDGQLYAGTANIVCGLEAAEIGNEAGVETKIIISSSLAMGYEYRKLLEAQQAHVKAINLVELHLGPLSKNLARIQFLKPELRKKMQTLADKLMALRKSLKELEDKIGQKQATGKHSERVRINFIKNIFNGVVLRAADQVYEIKENLAGPATIEYSLLDNKFSHSPLAPLECIFTDKPDVNEGEKNGDR